MDVKQLLEEYLPFLQKNDGKLYKYHIVDEVELYESQAVQNFKGNSFGSPFGYLHRGKATTSHEQGLVAKGTLTLNGDRTFFDGIGQTRTVFVSNINRIVYFEQGSAVEVNTTDSLTSMTFVLKGRTVDDAGRLCDAIRLGHTEVLLTVPRRETSLVTVCCLGLLVLFVLFVLVGLFV